MAEPVPSPQVTQWLTCNFCRWRVHGPIDKPARWVRHMEQAHPEYWEKRQTLVAAFKGHGTYDTNYPEACGRLAFIALGVLGLAPEFDGRPTP